MIRNSASKLLATCATGAVLAFVSASAHAQTRVENVAGFTYTDADGVVRGGNSNMVVTDILDVRTPPKVEYFVEGPGGTPTLVSGGCGVNQPTTVNLVPAQAAAAGTNLYVIVTDVFSNKSATAIDTVQMSVRSGNSTVSLTLVETDVDTGRFAGVVRTTLEGTPADACTLAVGSNGNLSGTYTNGVSPALVPTLDVSPFNVVFDSSTREIVDGSVVTIVDATTGIEAKPLGVDGRSSYPGTVTAGQTYSDSSGHRYLVPKGGFTFPLLPAGSYKIVVRPAGSYSFPSASSPEDFADKPVVAGKVVNVLTDASYGRAFTVSQNAIFDADVPLDGGQGSIVVSKAVSVDRASPGDYLQYQVVVQNAGASGTLSRPTLTDVMPKGIRFQKGSLRVDGVRVADPSVAADGATMTAILPALPSGKSYTLTYVGLVTSNAPIGDAVNQASVRSGGVVSSIARAGVRIDGGLFSDAVTIIGRVVSDACTIDGKTAKPVSGVRVLLEDGTYVVTDDNGQYHIENVRPGLHVAQMDRNSIPEGYRPARCGDDTRRGGSDISQFVDARGGTLWRADFFLDRAPGAQAPSSQVAPALSPSPLTTPSLMGSASPLTNASPIPGSAVRVVDGSPLAAPVAGSQAVHAGQPAEVAAALDTTIVVTGQSITSTLATPKVDPKLSVEDRETIAAAGGGVNWIERATGATEILFPAPGHNPRTSVTRIVVAHGGNDAAVVSVNGKPVDALLYEGSTSNPSKTAGVDVWNAVPLEEGDNVIDVQIKSPDGKITKLTRTVAFVNTAEKAQIVPTASKLVADGRKNPVIAVRVVDGNGRPVRSGISGRLDVSAPYMTADSVQRRRDSQLIQQNTTSQSTWTVKGDDGIAYIELAPTTQTGEVRLNMHLRDRVQSETRLRDSGSVLDRRDELSAWLSPGDQEWVVVGFGAASAGYTTLARQAEALTANPGDTNIVDGQVKLYAKGRIKGRWLLTLAYDSDKKSDRQRRQSVLSTIDPDAYYTLYGDTAQQGYDAQSTKDIFVKIETRQFYALFGDFTTGISDTELGQYQRTLTGVKTQYQSQKTGITAFVASTPFRHERDEIQGMGLTGPYQLQRRDLVLNTERVRIETRDAQRPELIKSTRDLVRFQDYDVDYARGTITLRAPLTSRDASFDPNFLVIDYETYGDAQNRLVAGGRVTQQVGGKVLVGATGIHSDDDDRTTMGTIDATVQVDASTRVRAEAGYSTGRGRDGHAYVVEAQRRTEGLDARVYVREQTLDFGVGQQNAVEAGYRKIGADVATRLTKGIELAGSAYSLGDLTSQAQRQGIRADLRAQIDANTNVTANVQHVRERGTAGDTVSTTQLGGTASRALMNGKLIVTGEAATTIGGNSTVATPTRYRVGGSYAFTQSIRGVVDHEIATGSGVTGANTRVGVETQPWNGATVGASWNRQSIIENGERTYGAFGAKQSFRIDKRWSADLSVDSQRTIKGVARPDIVNPLNPPSLGGRVDNGYFDDDFTSLSGGLGYQSEKTSWTGRVETRLGDNRRYGLTTALVHQLADGKVWGGSASAYRLNQYDGGGVDHADAAFAIALRRPDSRLQLLDKLEMIYDGITLGSGSPSSSGTYGLPASQNAIGVLAGSDYGPVAATSKEATSLRFVNNLAINWIAAGSEERGTRTQVSFYYGSKYGIQTFDGDRYGGYTDMISLEARHDVTRWLDIGIQAGARHSWSQGTMQWSLGPTIGVSPIKNSWLSLGYNVTGFEDRDFAGARSTIKGPWVAFRMKFDEETLGLARRRR